MLGRRCTGAAFFGGDRGGHCFPSGVSPECRRMISEWVAPAGWAANVVGAALLDADGPLRSWMVYFLLTLTLEVPMVLAVWRFRGCRGALRPWLLACIVGNLLSHPTATWLGGLAGLPGQSADAFATYTVLETGVIALEAWVFRVRATQSWTEAVVMSFAVNAITAVLGAYIMFS